MRKVNPESEEPSIENEIDQLRERLKRLEDENLEIKGVLGLLGIQNSELPDLSDPEFTEEDVLEHMMEMDKKAVH